MSLQTIEQSLAAAAQAEWARIKAEGIVIEQELIADAKTTFETICAQFGPLVMQTISSLATGELAKLTGTEKTNLAATTVVDGAAQQGITLLAEDATALIKNGFEAFKNAAPAIVPAEIAAAAQGALGTAETAVEGAVGNVASEVKAKL